MTVDDCILLARSLGAQHTPASWRSPQSLPAKPGSVTMTEAQLLDFFEAVIEADRAQRQAEPLTDAQCDEFRRHNGSFNDMVRHIFKAGQAQTALDAKDAEISALRQIVDSARHALNNSRDASDHIALTSHDAASLSLLLDEYDAAIAQPRP